MDETDGHLFFVLDRPAMLVVPKRCFSSTQALDEFKDFAIRHVGTREPSAAPPRAEA